MAGTLSFGLKLDGAPQAKAQLQEILGLQQKLSKSNILAGLNPAAILRSPDLLGELRRMTAQSPKNFPYGAFLNQTMGIGAGQNQPGRKGYQNFWQSMVPPQLVPPVIPKGVNWKQAGLGALVSPFSPWIGARALGGSGLFGQGGSGLFGAGGFAGFAAAFLSIKFASEGLKAAFEGLKNSVNEGSKLFRDSAKTSVELGKLFSLKSAAAAIGISNAELDTLLLRGTHQSNRTGNMRQTVSGQIFGAARGVAQIGDMQRLANMSKEFQDVFKNSLLDAAAWRTMAKDFQDISSLTTEVGREFKTLVAQIVDVFGDEIKALLKWTGAALKAANLDVLMLRAEMIALVKGNKAAQEFLAGQQPGNKTLPSPMSHHGSGSAWERMGFVMSGASSSDHARKTSENTKTTAQGVQKMVEIMSQMTTSKKGMFGPAVLNLP